MKKPRAKTPLIHVHWVARLREPIQPADPQYQNGIDVDLTGGDRRVNSCKVTLPYPAERSGYYVATCGRCGFKTIITTAGRADDPKSVRLPCFRRRHADRSAEE
jgi:hypothetical protein